MVQNKSTKNKKQHDLCYPVKSYQQEQSHKDNTGDKMMTTTNKFETLMDLTDDKHDGVEKSVENPISESEQTNR